MLSYTQLVEQYKLFTNDKSTENETFGAAQINSNLKARLGESDWTFLEKTRTDTTVADQQAYQLPADFDQMRTITVTQGSTVWSLYETPSRQAWDLLNTITYESDIAQYYYIIDDQVLIYPIPSSNGNTITYNYKKKVPKLQNADYTTGTISITSGAKAVTGSGTTFTAAMVGRYLMTTDGFWYEIASYSSATSITLSAAYLGGTVSGGTYTIGELSPLPDAYEMLPIYDSADAYFIRQGNFDKSKFYRERSDELARKMKTEDGAKSSSPRVRHNDGSTINPNLFIRL